MEDKITIRRYILPTNEEMGKKVGRDVGKILREYTVQKDVRVLASFAAAPSQDTFLAQLCREKGIDWDKVIAIHLDEYIELPRAHPNTFEVYLKEHLFDKVSIPEANIHYIKELEGTPEQIATEYENKIEKLIADVREESGIYLSCIGIGVNGHIAFNEPHVDKRTERMVIPIEIDETSVQQQYDDYKNHPNPEARYSSFEEVPRKAITLSCAGILESDIIYCTVPGPQKADAVKAMWDGHITDDLPASLLRMHPSMFLYLDRDSANKLEKIPKLN